MRGGCLACSFGQMIFVRSLAAPRRRQGQCINLHCFRRSHRSACALCPLPTLLRRAGGRAAGGAQRPFPAYKFKNVKKLFASALARGMVWCWHLERSSVRRAWPTHHPNFNMSGAFSTCFRPPPCIQGLWTSQSCGHDAAERAGQPHGMPPHSHVCALPHACMCPAAASGT